MPSLHERIEDKELRWYSVAMKCKSVLAFEKQLKESSPGSLSRIYLILVPDPYERKFYVFKLFRFLSHYKPHLTLQSGDEGLEMGLFSEERVIHLEVDSGLKVIPGDVIAIYSGEKCPNAFYAAIENQAVCLDLTGEKPWDKKERLAEELLKMARQNQKTMSLSVANQLLEIMGNDLAALKNEMDKLALFTGDRKTIVEDDIEKVTKTEKEVTAWATAEALVWKIKGVKRQYFKDLSEVLALIALVRHHIYLGIQICRGGDLPPLRKNQMDVYIPFCNKVGPNYFFERLALLFEWEVKAKSSSFNLELLWDLLVIHYDTLPTTEFAFRAS